LLFGALITPTDPISVLAILKKAGAPKKLRTILEGESLFNDGTGVVLFTVILGLTAGNAHFNLGHTVLEFFLVTGGGTLIGAAAGYAAYRAMKNIDDHLHEVAISVVLVFGTPLLAEALHCSGIIAIVVAGLIMGNYGRLYSMSQHTRESLENFWEVIEFLINSILFLVIGIELQEIIKTDLLSYAGMIGLGIEVQVSLIADDAFVSHQILFHVIDDGMLHIIFNNVVPTFGCLDVFMVQFGEFIKYIF